ncbi:MAG: EamA family transporter [Telmatospirillum sp.]|nr:EamA family transporter [Telmatospirillum sp.]
MTQPDNAVSPQMRTRAAMGRDRLSAYLATAAALVLWASSFVAIRYCLRYFTPSGLAALRYAIAAVALVVLSPLIRGQGSARTGWRDLPLFVLFGLLGIVGYNIGLNLGEQTVTAATSSFVVAQIPISTVILQFMFFQDKISRGTFFGILLGLLGTTIIVLSETSGSGFGWGAIFIVGAIFSESAYFVLQKDAIHRLGAYRVNLFTILAAGICMSPLLGDLFTAGFPDGAGPWIAVLYLGLFPAALAYFLWTYAIRELGPVITATSLYALPFLTLLIGFLCLGEQPVPMALCGGALALSGAYLAHRFRQ